MNEPRRVDRDGVVRDGVIEENEHEVEGSGAMATISRVEIDVQIATARRFPRSIKTYKAQAIEMATLDEDTATSMFYALVRDKKRIEGPSVRLAEVCGSAWGHLHYGARTVDVGANFLRAQGVAWDLEKNVKCVIEVSRRITNRDGRRYSDDMIVVTENAAKSIALRNAIFKVIPSALIKPIFEAAKAVSIGQGLSMEKRRERAFEWFGKLNVKPEELLALLGRRGLEDVTLDDLVAMQGMRTAITDGDTSVADLFKDIRSGVQAPPTPIPTELKPLMDQLGMNDAARDMFMGEHREADLETMTAALRKELAAKASTDVATTNGAGEQARLV